MVDNILNHLSDQDNDTKCFIIAKLIDQESPEFAKLLTKSFTCSSSPQTLWDLVHLPK